MLPNLSSADTHFFLCGHVKPNACFQSGEDMVLGPVVMCHTGIQSGLHGTVFVGFIPVLLSH
jgi:hypothetical protein